MKKNEKDIIEINESGEKLTKRELEQWVIRIRDLPKEKIDELWYRTGFIYSGKDNNKALPTENIKQIKLSPEYARDAILRLFDESKIERIRKNLDDIEKGK